MPVGEAAPFVASGARDDGIRGRAKKPISEGSQAMKNIALVMAAFAGFAGIAGIATSPSKAQVAALASGPASAPA